MFALYAEVVSRYQTEKTDTDDIIESDTIERLYLLKETAEDEATIDAALFEASHLILQDVFRLFASKCDQQAFERLTQLESLRKEFGSTDAKNFVGFHMNRFRAFGFAWLEKHLKAVKASNKAIARCPSVDGARAKGLVDLLIIISDSYSVLNQLEDAVHSAKLAVDIAHEQLEKTVDETFINGTESEEESRVDGVRNYMGPILNNNLMLILAYFNLATQLRHSNMVEASITWYEKSIQTSENNGGVEEDIISVLYAGLADAEKYLNEHVESGRNIQAHDTMVSDLISNGIEGLDARGDNDGGGVSQGYPQTDNSLQSQHDHNGYENHSSQLSSRNQRYDNAGSRKRKTSEGTSMTSSVRNDPAQHDPSDGQSHSNTQNDVHDIYDDIPRRDPLSQEERSDDYNNMMNYPVENMTNNSTIPTQTQISTANSSYGGGTRGWKSKKHDPNSTNDDISHITGDDENRFPHYFYPTRPRPKSAVSKLGGNYDSVSVTSGASTPKKERQKRHSFGGEMSSRHALSSPGKIETTHGHGDDSRGGLDSPDSSAVAKKYADHRQLHEGQLYDNSEVNRMVVERSMEWNGQADSTDVPIPTFEMLLGAEVKEPLLKSVQDALSKQLNSMIQFREKVYRQKKEVKEQEKLIQIRERQRQKDISKAERKRDLSTAVEMNFERRCAHDDRAGIFDSILRAQRLKAIDDIQFVERGSEHFFEGMVVDIKRSSKANSERDRCVIVRARVNGTFDAEIIENGELLINIHPNVIRIPTLPSDDKRIVAREYSVGEKVSCRAGKYGRWFTGFIEKVLSAGHYKIEFTDGTIEDGVSHKRLRPAKSTSEKDPASGFDIALVENEFYVGQEVLMRFPYGCKWRLCTVTKVRCDGESYDVLLNGRQEAEKGVSRSCLRHQGSLLYGYGNEYCPSRRTLARCLSHHNPEDSSLSPGKSDNQEQERVFINSQGDYSLKTPPKGKKATQLGKHYHTTGKKSNRQLEDGNMLAVSRSDRILDLKQQQQQQLSPAKSPIVDPGSPTKQERGMAATPSATVRVVNNPATNGVAISTMRDRFVQEMHRNVSLLNTSATERKFARIIRHERNRIEGIVRIQAVARGYVVRSKMKLMSQHVDSSKKLQGDEIDLSAAQIELMDRYMQALSVAIFKNNPVEEGNVDTPPARPMTASSMAAMKRVANLITSDLPDEFGLEEAAEMDDEVDVFDRITDPIEKMKMEMLDIHQQQLKKQRDEMKELFMSEMKGLGSQIMRNIHPDDENQHLRSSHHLSIHSQHAGALESFRQSGVGSASLIFQNELSHSHIEAGIHTQSRVDSEQNDNDSLIFGLDETVIQDIDWMKDMYLSVWGNAEFKPVEVVAIIAKSKTHFTIQEASLKDQLRPVVHMANGSNEFIGAHHIFYVKEPENKENFALRVRLVNSTGKACRLKCPGDKVADLCENKRTVRITLDSKNSFEIASSSLRLDVLSQCLERLWDAHVAWMAQRLLIRIALHRVVQGISALFVSFPDGEEEETAEGTETQPGAMEGIETKTEPIEKEEVVEPLDETEPEAELEDGTEKKTNEMEDFEDMLRKQARPKDKWVSHRYILFQELSSIIRSGQEHFEQYQSSLQQTQFELISLIESWRFFEYTSSVSLSIPVNDLSEQLYQLASSLFTPYEAYFTVHGSESYVDSEVIKENLKVRHNQETIQPILRGIYMDFVAYFAVGKIFEEFCLSPLMTLSHQKTVKGYAYAETYEWQSLCAHSRTWAYLLHGYDVDYSSPTFHVAYETYLNIVLQADAEVYKPRPRIEPLDIDSSRDRREAEGGGGSVERVADFHEEIEPQQGLEVISVIEKFTSRVLSNTLEMQDPEIL